MISLVVFNRRHFSSALACTVGAPLFLGCAAPPEQARPVIDNPKPNVDLAAPVKPTKFLIDDPKLTTVDDLIAAMKNVAGSSLPSTAQAKDFYQAIADAFVQNMHAIAEAGVNVPKEMLAKLRKRNLAAPIMVVVVLWGITFLVPLAFFGKLVLASLVVIGLFIWASIEASSGNGKKVKV
jgi:hypothetical protein